MGQQQLLLIVLGIVIVGFAIVAGLQGFVVNQKKSNADALQLTSMRIASDAQAWLSTPAVFGGGLPPTGGRYDDYTGLSLDLTSLGYPVDGSNRFTDVNGIYTASVSGGSFVITANSINTTSDEDNMVCTIVSGPLLEHITSEVNPNTANCTNVIPTP